MPISGTVHEDPNGNGVRNPGEPGIPGVIVVLTGTDAAGNPVNLTATTDANGNYSFPSVPTSNPAGYTITETQPNIVSGIGAGNPYFGGAAAPGNNGGSGSPNGNVISGVVITSTSAPGTNYNFAELRPARVAGAVYFDANNNNQRDVGENGIPGITVKLTGTDDLGAAVNLTATTDASGNYLFDVLRPGTYTVTETQPKDFVDGAETTGSLGGATTTNDAIGPITVHSGDDGTNYLFGERRPTLSGSVYVDSNNNGVRDTGEVGIPGVTITVTGTDTNGKPVNLTTVTQADGSWSLPSLPLSDATGYTVRETQPATWADGLDHVGNAGGTLGNDVITGVVINAGTDATGYDFGERGATLKGQVFNDANDNGVRDPNEVPISGVKVTLTGNDANGTPVMRMITTGPDGSYTFPDLPTSGLGGFMLTETQPTGYTDGKDMVGTLGGSTPANDTINVAITTAGGTGTAYNFAEFFNQPASLSGRVYLDGNHDRVDNDPAGSGRGGWIVELIQRTNGSDTNPTVVATTTTDNDGKYNFTNLVPGDYEIRFRNPDNGVAWGRPQSTEPGVDLSFGTIRNLTLAPGQNVLKQDLPLDPSGVVYDSLSRQPVPGARVTISGPPGFDPATQLLPGEQGQTTGPDGAYQFLLLPGAPAGDYRITVTPPAEYTLSNLLPVQPGALNATTCVVDPSPADPCLVQQNDRAPNGTDPTTYFFTLTLGPGAQNVVNNHIPLDPGGGFTVIDLRKMAGKVNVTRGELVPYTITARNTRGSSVSNVALVDTIPPGFQYVKGSAQISVANGVTQALEPVANNRVLAFPPIVFAPNEVRTLKMLLVVGTGVGEGKYVNQVVARLGNASGKALSNQASATVRIVADPLFDCTDLIGKVYDDKDANGYQDEGEKGLAGVRVVTARGELITTDPQGRFHVQCAVVPNADIGSNYILKLDERTLPSGYRVTTNNPLTERLTRGRIVKMNFGATVHRLVRLDLASDAFEANSSKLQAQFTSRLPEVIAQLRAAPSVLRLAYAPAASEAESLTRQRAHDTRAVLLDAWSHEKRKDANGNEVAQYNLDVEIEIVKAMAGRRAQP